VGVRRFVAGLSIAAAAAHAGAQSTYPEQPVRILDVIGGTPAEFASAIERETPRWARVIKKAGIKASD
jgi:tripartite-type tricarboxylate transporter receptor subunit TctC